MHDVSEILLEEGKSFPEGVRSQLKKMAEISRDLRRDRELAYYGTEDLTPSEFYKKIDAERALQGAKFVVETVEKSAPKKRK